MSESKIENNIEQSLVKSLNTHDKKSWSPMLFLIRLYQKYISPLLGQNCRFTPSCSQYMVEAITEHGHLKGAFLGSKRICKCHPWHEGGYDPVVKK